MRFDVPKVRKEQEKGNKDQPWTKVQENPFESLRVIEVNTELAIEEIEHQPHSLIAKKEVVEAPHPRSLAGIFCSPSYAKVERKKPLESLWSLEDESIERSFKKVGRKSYREAQEEEAERKKMQRIQATIKMTMGRNTRKIPPEGGSTH